MAGTNSELTKFVSNGTIRRLVKDITSLHKFPLTDQGIFYEHDTNNMLIGRAMIIGPEDTPYAHGFYFFEFEFPTDYPVRPPVLQYLTNDGLTRFHPNLYRRGKVCLSLLNTWKGEGWTSCQTIRSVLLTLVSILDDKPLLHEPHISETHVDFKNYTEIIRFKNFQFAHGKMLSNKCIPKGFDLFYPTIIQHCSNNTKKILKLLEYQTAQQCDKPVILKTRLYGLHVVLDYAKLNSKLRELHKNLYDKVEMDSTECDQT